MTYLFTSESVSEGHPDKVCDQISDTILDLALEQDPNSHMAIETFATTNLIVVGGETKTNATINVESAIRNVLSNIGYTSDDIGISASDCTIQNVIHTQSPDIAMGVELGTGKFKEEGAGDQGLMFGYACKQTPELMPLPIQLAHKLMFNLSTLRKSNILGYLRPDSKAQVTVEYADRRTPLRIDTIVISTQHAPDVDQDTIQKDIISQLIRPTIPSHLLDDRTKILINPTGRFVIGGPHGDAGLTGRKIIVDTYGGWANHGGGAFSGKDSTKVDRSAAYMARYIAKNLVAADLAEEVQIQLAYAIGVAEPVSIHIDTFGTSTINEKELVSLVRNHFGLTPREIITTLNLTSPQFKHTAAYGHFGRTDVDFTWERTDKVEILKKKANLATA